MKIQTLLSYYANGPRTIDIPFDCTVLAMLVHSQMSSNGEFIIATANGSSNKDTSGDGSVLLYGSTFTSAVDKPWISFGPLQMLLPMKQHDLLYIRGNDTDPVIVVLTVEVNRQA